LTVKSANCNSPSECQRPFAARINGAERPGRAFRPCRVIERSIPCRAPMSCAGCRRALPGRGRPPRRCRAPRSGVLRNDQKKWSDRRRLRKGLSRQGRAQNQGRNGNSHSVTPPTGRFDAQIVAHVLCSGGFRLR
jgi:hypothetical protein